jgi:hypothetical protein
MGFLIDAATYAASVFQGTEDTRVANNLAEIIVRTYNNAPLCRAVVDGVDSQA